MTDCKHRAYNIRTGMCPSCGMTREEIHAKPKKKAIKKRQSRAKKKSAPKEAEEVVTEVTE